MPENALQPRRVGVASSTSHVRQSMECTAGWIHSRAPRALPRVVDSGMAAVINNKKRILRLMLLDQLAEAHHELEVGILGRNGKDVGAKGVLLAKTLFQVFQLGQHEQVVGPPVEKEYLDLAVPLGASSAVGKGASCGLVPTSEAITEAVLQGGGRTYVLKPPCKLANVLHVEARPADVVGRGPGVRLPITRRALMAPRLISHGPHGTETRGPNEPLPRR